MSSDRQRQLTWVLAVTLVASLFGVVYLSFTPEQDTDPYTEFYILGSEGNASDYPKNPTVNERATLIVGITNHEHHSMQYTLVFQLGNETIDTKTVSVESGETWEQEQVFIPQSAEQEQLHLFLYRGEQVESSSEPYQSLHLWVDVQED